MRKFLFLITFSMLSIPAVYVTGQTPSRVTPVSVVERKTQSVLVDFGKEMFGIVKLHTLKGKGNVGVYYGMSREEALDKANCKILDTMYINHGQPVDLIMKNPRNFRYVYVEYNNNIVFDAVSMLRE